MMRRMMVVSRAYLLEWAAAASGGVDNWRGSPWRQWWRRQALAPVCVFAMYSSARVRLGSDFGFYAHGPWKRSRRERNDPRAVHVYAYSYVYVYVYVYLYMYISGFCLTAAWRILVSFLLVSFSLVCFRSLAAAVGWCNCRWRVLPAQFTVQFNFDVTGVFRVTGSSCCRNGSCWVVSGNRL